MRQIFKQFFNEEPSSQGEPTEAELIFRHNLANETQKEVYRAYLSQQNITIPDYLKCDSPLLNGED